MPADSSGGVTFLPEGRSRADCLAEHTGEVRLIGKTRLGGNRGQRGVAPEQHLLCPFDPRIHVPLVRRDTRRSLEGVAEVRLGEAREAGELLEPDITGEILLDEIDRPPQLPRRKLAALAAASLADLHEIDEKRHRKTVAVKIVEGLGIEALGRDQPGKREEAFVWNISRGVSIAAASRSSFRRLPSASTSK